MLDIAIATLGEDEHPIVHSDRGTHYRWSGWIERIESACEGFLGHLKNEMFYNRSWAGVSIDEFIEILDQYIHWYAEKRIKVSLGGLSPLQYRQAHGIAS